MYIDYVGIFWLKWKIFKGYRNNVDLKVSFLLSLFRNIY